MKRTPSLTFVLITLVLLLASCSRSGPGPSSWIDKPLDKSSYPLQPLEIIAHASSDAGVSSIEFTVDDTLIGIVRVGGNRFEIARQAWHPEEPGVYQVKITSLDSAGQRGPEAVSIVYIGNNEIDWLAQGGAGYGDCDPVEVLNFVADPPAILPGECANIFWEVLSPGEHGVIVDGEGVPSFGEMRVCPEETRPFELIVRICCRIVSAMANCLCG